MQTMLSLNGWGLNLLSLNPSKTEFLLIGLSQQFAKLSQNSLILLDNTTISATTTARNLGIILDSNLSFKQHNSSLSKSYFYHIRDLRRIWSTLDFDTARTIGRLQVIQNALVRAVTNTPKFVHITPILKTLHWLKIRQLVECKVISLTYTALQQREPRYLLDKLNLRPPGSTRSSSL